MDGKPLPKRKKVSVAKYKRKLDALFSQWIRIKEADEDGMNFCFTCGVKKHWKELQCGHFIPRQYLSLRYDELNCHPQCYACNMLYNGQPSAYAVHLQRIYGHDIIANLESKRRAITYQFPYELEIEKYKAKLKAYEV